MSGTRCLHCQSEVPPNANFCSCCGIRLATSEPRTTLTLGKPDRPGLLEGEHKQITALFADLKGSTELVVGRDSEEAYRLLDPVLQCMLQAVSRFDGFISTLNGDGIMALFGAPLAHEDHAVRACYAALQMHELVKSYAEDVQRSHGIAIQIRVGINSGEALIRMASSGGSTLYTAVGETVHIAARMEQAAMPGSTLITRSTLLLSERHLQVKRLGLFNLKGLTNPVDAYEILAAQGRRRLSSSTTRELGPFVGRQREIQQLKALWRQTVAEQGQAAALVGEPGIGKSRLVREFVRSCLRERCRVLECGSVPYGQSTAYLPLKELLATFFNVADGGDYQALREVVADKLGSLDSALQRYLPALLYILDIPTVDADWEQLDPHVRREKTSEALLQLLLAVSKVEPLLIVVEDLHWADSGTASFLADLLSCAAAARMMLLVTYRPSFREQLPAPHSLTELELNPLPSDNVSDLLDTLLGLDESLRSLKAVLVERTAGNPFFVEESVKSIAESGTMAGAPGAYQLTRQPIPVRVPSTVQPIIAERIDRLEPVHKQLLQAAAVIGLNVRSALLQAVVELPEETVRLGVSKLLSAGYLQEISLLPDPEYSFKHVLIHDVAYESLLHERRRKIHGRVVTAIERLYHDRILEHVDLLSRHALQGEIWDKAVSYSDQAGRIAAAKSAHREAVVKFEAAIAALERMPRTRSALLQAIELRFSLRASLSPLGEFQRSLELLSEAEALATALNDESRLSRVFTFKALFFWSTGMQGHAIEAAEQALGLTDPTRDPAGNCLPRLFWGRALHARGNYTHAIRLFNEVIEATDLDRTNFLGMANLPSVSARAWLAWAMAEQGIFAEAQLRAEEAIDIGEVTNHLVSRIYGYMALGIVQLRSGRVDTAAITLERAYSLSHRADLNMAQATVAGYLGRAYTLTNRTERAKTVLSSAIRLAASMGLMVHQAVRLIHLAEAELQSNNLDLAMEVGESALKCAVAHHERGSEAWAEWLLGEILLRRPDIDGAREHHARAALRAAQLGLKPLLEIMDRTRDQLCPSPI